MKESQKKEGDDDKKDAEPTPDELEQQQKMAELLGIKNLNQHGPERSMVERSLRKLEDLRGDFRFIQDEIDERAVESKDNLENLPEQMC